jgi:hypothetical protein
VRDFNLAYVGSGSQLPLVELVERFRFTPISGPYLNLMDWPKGATSGREQLQQFLQANSPMRVCVYLREGCPFCSPCG